MASFNRVVLVGNLTRDPELRYTQSGVAVVNFTIAVDRAFKGASGERETDFIDIVVWRQLAENCEKYLAKGRLCGVQGRLQTGSYQDKNGNNRTAFEVIGDSVELLDGKNDGQGAGEANTYIPDAYKSTQTPQFEDEKDDDLPF
jgi:single-strand DNA-binding protein